MEIQQNDLSSGKRFWYKYADRSSVYGPVEVKAPVISSMDGSRVLVVNTETDESFYVHLTDDGDDAISLYDAAPA
jgi:hypothetical protein